MKIKFLIAMSALFILASCGKNSSEYKELKTQYDSLMKITENYESEMSSTDSIISTILDNFKEISNVENVISLSDKNGDMPKGSAQRIKDNIQLINQKLEASSSAINELNEKLKASGLSNSKLAMTVNSLKKQLVEKTAHVEELIETLKKKDASLLELDTKVNSLNSDLDKMKDLQAEKDAMISSQDKELNTIRYCVGTSADLKDLKVVVDGKVAITKADNDYFTKADKRNLSSISLGETKKAKLLTPHAEEAYRFEKNNNGTMTLLILDKELFWKNSKVLVIQVY